MVVTPILPYKSGVVGKGYIGSTTIGGGYTLPPELMGLVIPQPLVQVEIYTSAWVLAGVIDDYESLTYTENWFEPDTWTIVINRYKCNVGAFALDGFIRFYCDYREHVGIIESIEKPLGPDGKGSEAWVITGRGVEAVFDHRICNSDTSFTPVSGITFAFTNNSTTVYASSNCRGQVWEGQQLYNLTNDNATYAQGVEAVSADGLTIALASPYLGTSGGTITPSHVQKTAAVGKDSTSYSVVTFPTGNSGGFIFTFGSKIIKMVGANQIPVSVGMRIAPGGNTAVAQEIVSISTVDSTHHDILLKSEYMGASTTSQEVYVYSTTDVGSFSTSWVPVRVTGGSDILCEITNGSTAVHVKGGVDIRSYLEGGDQIYNSDSDTSSYAQQISAIASDGLSFTLSSAYTGTSSTPGGSGCKINKSVTTFGYSTSPITFQFTNGSATVTPATNCHYYVHEGNLIYNSADDTSASARAISNISSDGLTITLVSAYPGTSSPTVTTYNYNNASVGTAAVTYYTVTGATFSFYQSTTVVASADISSQISVGNKIYNSTNDTSAKALEVVKIAADALGYRVITLASVYAGTVSELVNIITNGKQISVGSGTHYCGDTAVTGITFTFAASTTVIASANCRAQINAGEEIFNSTNDSHYEAQKVAAISADGLRITLTDTYTGTAGSGKACSRVGIPGESALRHYTDSECISATDPDRVIPGITLAADQKRGALVNRSARFDYLSDMLYGICVETGLSFRLVHGTGLNFTFTVYTGSDVSSTVTICPTLYENASTFDYLESHLEMRNMLYIGGEGSDAARMVRKAYTPTAGTGTLTTLYAPEVAAVEGPTGTMIAAHSFTPVDMSGMDLSASYLQLDLKATNPADMGTDGQVELTASGGPDSKELSWKFPVTGLKDTYQTYRFLLSSGSETGGAFDSSAINYIRVYNVLKAGAGIGSVPVMFSWQNAKILTASTPQGWTRREKFVDASDCTTSALLSARGSETLATSAESISLDVGYFPSPTFTLGVHFKLGDLITATFEGVATVVSRIRSVTTTLDSNGKVIALTIGKEAPDLISILKLNQRLNTTQMRR